MVAVQSPPSWHQVFRGPQITRARLEGLISVSAWIAAAAAVIAVPGARWRETSPRVKED